MTARHPTYSPEMEDMLSDMTGKQAMFCREYVIDWNGKRSAIAAGYSERTADVIASQNLVKVKIMEWIDAFLGFTDDGIEITASVIEREYWKLYRACIRDDNKQTARACLKDLGEHHAMFIKVVAKAESGELADRLRAGRTRLQVGHPLLDERKPAADGSDAEH